MIFPTFFNLSLYLAIRCCAQPEVLILPGTGSFVPTKEFKDCLYLYPYLLCLSTWRRKWQPTPVFLPGESQGWGRLVGCCLWGYTELGMTEVTQQ